MPAFNHFRSKRQAHSVSRASSDQAWNPFRHVVWNRIQAGRAETWDGGRLESQQPLRGQETHGADGGGNCGLDRRAATDPYVSKPETLPASARDHERSTPHAANDGAALKTQQMSELREPSPSSHSPAAVTSPGGPGLSPSDPGLRYRKPVGDEKSACTVPPSRDDHGKKTDNNNNDKSDSKGSKSNGLIRHVRPKTPFTVANQLQRTFLSSWINVLIIAAPVGVALNYVRSVSRVVVFVVNFIAIVPLAAMLGFATEEIALRTGETVGGLLNATFGNAVELIVAVIALVDNKVAIVKTSLVGSILSNLLLVMGCCFFFGGLRRQEQFFNTTVAQTAASLLALAAASVIVPSVFDAAQDTGPDKVAALSRGTAVILLLVYAAYLFFQLKTHQTVFSEQSQKVPAKPWSRRHSVGSGAIRQGLVMPGSLMGHAMPHQPENERLSRMLMHPPRLNRHGEPIFSTHDDDENENDDNDDDDDDDDDEEPKLHFAVAVATLAASTAIIALCAEYMVDSIDSVTRDGPLSVEFVGLILLPIVGNAAEHATAVTVAIKDKMDLAIGVAIGSSMQVALFLIPLLVVVGWGKGNEQMNLSLDFFQVAVMFVAVLLMNYLIADGKSHWLEGFLLICLYAIVAVCSFYYPDSATGEKQKVST